MGIQLDWDYTLPAWELYSGAYSQLYRRVSQNNWNKPCAKIKILSALFGWIKHTDLIPCYNLKMDDKITINNVKKPIWEFWFNTALLMAIINPETDIDLLSRLYRKAINGTGQVVAATPPVNFKGYGAQKGHWLNNQLNNLNCKSHAHKNIIVYPK